MHLKKMRMYQTTPCGICLRDETVSLKMEFAAENIFRMWTTLQEDFCQEETLVVERTVFNCPNVCVTEQDNLVMISTSRLTAYIHLEPFYLRRHILRENSEQQNGRALIVNVTTRAILIFGFLMYHS